MENRVSIDRLIKSNRKTVSLEVTGEGELVVRAPVNINKQYLEKVIKEKSGWIIKKQGIARQRLKNWKPKKFVSGEKFLYLGRYYPLKLVDSGRKKLEFSNGFYLLAGKRKDARKLFIKWYRQKAKDYLSQKTAIISRKLDIGFKSIRITSAEKRWGSCSPKGSLNFPWRLVMAPEKVIEYVIVHELIHVIDKSHSRKFWNKVEKAMPEYKVCQDWLKKNGYRLTL